MFLFNINKGKNNFFYKFFVILSLLIATAMQAHAERRTLISKDETNWIFGLSLDEWIKHATSLKNAKIAGYETNEAGEHTVIFNTEIAIMIVTPIYSINDNNSPWKVSTRFVIHENFEYLWRSLSDTDLKDLVNEIYADMLPEFTVFTSYIMNDKQVIQDITLIKYGYDNIADDMGQKKSGCFDKCVMRYEKVKNNTHANNESFFDAQNKMVVCSQPIPQFTLGIDSKPNQFEVAYLCNCIWSSFPVYGWERRTAEQIRKSDDPGELMNAFHRKFSTSFQICGAMDL